VRPDGTEFRRPLPDAPESSDDFLAAYRRAEDEWRRELAARAMGTPDPRTVAGAIHEWERTPEFTGREKGTRTHYHRHGHGMFGREFGHLTMRSIDWEFVERHRTVYADTRRVSTWNEIRKVMRMVTRRWMRLNRGVIDENPWEETARLKTIIRPGEEQNRPWPPEVIEAVFRAATPEFRALLMCYLFTGQRGSDVTRFGDAAVTYDPARRLLTFVQQKTRRQMDLPVPETLHCILTGADGASALVTPRGKRWNTGNAQETLRTLLTNLGLPRYTLQGLRSTVATELAHLGFGELVLMAQGGWKDSRAVQPYLRGAKQRRLLAPVPAVLEAHFQPILRVAEIGANEKRAAGLTGRAAAKAGVEGRARDRRRNAP
jgi:hypothetical protein